MSAQPQENPIALPTRRSADEGPMLENVPGFDERVLAALEEDEELFALEHGAALTEETQLPDEDAAPTAPEAGGGADAGDVGELHPGFAAGRLDAVEADEDLDALESSVDVATSAGGKSRLVDQPSNAPSRKVKGAGLGSLIATLPATLITALDGIPIPDQVLNAISTMLVILGAVAGAYFTRERAPEA